MAVNYDDKIDAGLEMYNYSTFVRDFHIWKITHLLTRIIPITPKFQLPWNSVIHLMDNIQYPQEQLQDTPRLSANPFITHEKYRKYIYHNVDFVFSDEDNKCPIDIDFDTGIVSDQPTERKYIFITNKLSQNLLNFKNKYKTLYRQLNTLDSVPRVKEALTIINHNPLFRVKVMGKLRFFRRMQLILASVFNTACKLPLDKNQYIHIPLTHSVFTKDAFLKSQKELSMVSIKYPNNYHYILMMNILNFIHELAHTSMLDNIPEEYQKRIVLLLTIDNKAIFYSLYDLKQINVKNSAYVKIVNQLNLFVMNENDDVKKIIEAIPDDEEIADEDRPDGVFEYDAKHQNDTTAKSDAIHTAINDVAKKIIKTSSSYSFAEVDALDNVLSKVADVRKQASALPIPIKRKDDPHIEEDDPSSMSESPEYENPSEEDVSNNAPVDDIARDTEELVSLIVEHDVTYSKNKQMRQLTTGVNTVKQNIDKKSIKEKTPIATDSVLQSIGEDVNGFVTNSPCVKVFNENDGDGAKRSKKYLDEMDAEAEQLIENMDLTPAQKERYKRIAKGYKNIVVGTKTVEEWLATPPNTSVTEASLDFLDGQIPDKSMLKSSIVTLDDEYMQKSFGRDMLGVVTSFTKNGMFLTDIKAEPISTELNKLVKYSFSYEDVNGKSSTIHITLPQINKHGHMYINGVKKILKKQMVNLPIVKVSETRVSLASAMNKTIVERNLAKAYSFDSYVSTILTKLSALPGITVNIVNASSAINLPIAYEYTVLARHYRSIDIKSPDKKVYMMFDHTNALNDLCKNNAQLKQMALDFMKSKNCVLFMKSEGRLGFITPDNIVLIMDKTGVQLNSETTNILGILRSVSNGRLKLRPLSEWVTLKIRDKAIPVIFVLAYQYGLINMLDYIGCHWIRIGKTDRRVIQESNPKKKPVPIPGVKLASESYQQGEKYIVKYDDIVIPFRDEYLVINRYPITQSLIVSGLNAFNTEAFTFNDMEETSTYFSLLELKGWSTNYLKAITGFFGYFIDHSTRDKLELMHEPTNPRDLLIRCAQLLSTEDHRPPASIANHCLRSYERINVILYNEMARALEEYQISGGAGSKFTINPQAVFQRIMSDQAIVSVEELNPVHDIKEMTGFTYTGIGGRTAQSFVMADRQYPEDGIGVISESTVDSGKVGIVAVASVNPTLTNTRGIFEHVDPEKLDPTQYLSISSLLMPCVTNDDQFGPFCK